MTEARARCSCGKLAVYFGQFAGGVCESHVDGVLENGGMDQFWPESQARLSHRLPFKPNDWVTDDTRVARIKDVYWSDGEVLLDLYIYSLNGDQLGRTSPAMGGPRSYEPCCTAKNWIRIPRPTFPIEVKWITDPKKPGVKTMGYWFGHPLPPAKWSRPPKRPKARVEKPWQDVPQFSHEQLNHLVDLFADANDPMSRSVTATADALRRFIWASKYRDTKPINGDPT